MNIGLRLVARTEHQGECVGQPEVILREQRHLCLAHFEQGIAALNPVLQWRPGTETLKIGKGELAKEILL